MKLRVFIILLSIFMNGALHSQNTCFNYNTIVEQRDALRSFDSIHESDKVYLANLKGCSFPADELYTIENGKLSISGLKGNLVFVHFWFTGCHPCLEEMPEIVRLSKKYGSKNVKFVNITFEEKNKLISFLTENKMPGIIQTYQEREILEKKFCVMFGYPMCCLLDKNGNVIEAWSGGGFPDAFYKKVSSLIDKNL